MIKRVLIYSTLTSSIFILTIITYIYNLSTIVEYPSTPIIVDNSGQFLTDGVDTEQDYGFWQIDIEKNSRILTSLISIEDKRFYKHFGIDFKSIIRALKMNLIDKVPEGGSTLAMQVVRIQEQKKRTVLRKLLETPAAYLMTIRYGRDSVLKQYSSIVSIGKRFHGFSYGSRRFFKKPIEDLSWAEASLLVSLPKLPSKMDLTTYKGMLLAKTRAELVLKRLFNQNFIDKNTYEREKVLLDSFKALSIDFRTVNTYHYLLRLNEELSNKGYSDFTTTTKANLDLDLQKYVMNYVNEIYPDLKKQDIDNIAIIVTKADGSVITYVGSQDYFNQKAQGSINFANRRRSSGSTLKPFLYLKALDDGIYKTNSIIDDLPIQIVDNEGNYIAANYDEDFLGPMLFRKTLGNSRNIPSVKILEKVGINNIYNYFNSLNFVHRDLTTEYFGYGLILGGLYVTLESLMESYLSLLNDGERTRLKWYESDKNMESKKIGTTFNSRVITDILSDPLARLPSFKRLGPLEYSYPVAIKTGTSQGYRDAWTIAYSSDYAIGIWIGRHDNEPTNHFSGSSAAKYIKPIMDYLHQDEVKGFNHKPFKKPDNSVEVQICPLSGMLTGPFCDNSVNEIFKESDVPVEYCSVHISLAIDIRNGLIATHQTPVDKIIVKSFTNLPLKYATWSKKNGLDIPSFSDKVEFSETLLKVTSPQDGARFVYDYSIPKRFQTIPLVAEVNNKDLEVDFYVNGKLYKTVGYPFETRFNLDIGSYIIEAKVGRNSSNKVSILVE